MLALPGCKWLGRGKTPAAQDKDKDKGKEKTGPQEAAQKDETAHTAADGGTLDDVEAEYTPRKLSIDEEECDDVARDALSKLRQQVRETERRSAELEKKERDLAQRKQAIDEAAHKVEEKVAALDKLRAEIEGQIAPEAQRGDRPPKRLSDKELAEERSRKEERLQKVTAMVGGMSSRRAAQLLAGFDDNDLAVEVLESLPREQAGKLLGQMDPKKAALLAERIGDGPKPEAKIDAKIDAKPEAKIDAKPGAKPKGQARIDGEGNGDKGEPG